MDKLLCQRQGCFRLYRSSHFEQDVWGQTLNRRRRKSYLWHPPVLYLFVHNIISKNTMVKVRSRLRFRDIYLFVIYYVYGVSLLCFFLSMKNRKQGSYNYVKNVLHCNNGVMTQQWRATSVSKITWQWRGSLLAFSGMFEYWPQSHTDLKTLRANFCQCRHDDLPFRSGKKKNCTEHSNNPLTNSRNTTWHIARVRWSGGAARRDRSYQYVVQPLPWKMNDIRQFCKLEILKTWWTICSCAYFVGSKAPTHAHTHVHTHVHPHARTHTHTHTHTGYGTLLRMRAEG